MTPNVSSLTIMAAAMLAMSAGVLGLFGLSSRAYQGHWWWASAQGMVAFGVLLGSPGYAAAATPSVALCVLASALMLQWPVAMLAGLRRFYARREWRLPASVDLALLTLGLVGIAGTCFLSGTAADAAAAHASMACLLQLYAVWLVMQLPEFSKGVAIKVFAAAGMVGATLSAWHLFQSLALGTAAAGTNPLGLTEALVGGLIAIAMVYGVPLLASERTESNLRMAHRQLRFLADMDMLTGVPNRRHFHERAGALLATHTEAPVCLLMFDVDHFKHINDRLGHAAGDEALRQVARSTRDSLREMDIAGRLGGDEFAVLLPDASIDDAMSVASRIVMQLEHRQVAPRVAWLSLSFGVVQLHADEGVDNALRRADQALYEAKRQGRARAVAATGYEDDPVFGESRPLGLTPH